MCEDIHRKDVDVALPGRTAIVTFVKAKEHLGRDYISVKNATFLTRRLERVSERLFTSAFFL
jgi:hypothetical protein